MILLDTHIWIWWRNQSNRLPPNALRIIREHSPHEIGVSVISCWEVAKLVERERLKLSLPVEVWIRHGLVSLRLFHLTPEIAVASTQLPGDFHRDPADQIIVATARLHDIPLVTADQRIREYPYVTTL